MSASDVHSVEPTGSAVSRPLLVRTSTSSTVSTGLGTGIQFNLEDSEKGQQNVANIEAAYTNSSKGQEAAQLNMSVLNRGVANAPALFLRANADGTTVFQKDASFSAAVTIASGLSVSAGGVAVTPLSLQALTFGGSVVTAGTSIVEVTGVETAPTDFIELSALSGFPVGHTITIVCNASSNFLMISNAGSNEKINNVDADGTNAYLCTDTDTIRLTKVSNTAGWIAQSITILGAVRAAVIPS